jgi:simple sugar transport system ATP-binding protein
VRDLAGRRWQRVGVEMDPDAAVETLSVAHKQLVAICRALASDARLIIMDEPTTALTEREVRGTSGIIRRLKADGVAVLFVSHKLAEVLEVCEKVVVLRNGRKVAEGPASDFDAASLTRHMTGRDVAETPPDPADPAAPVLMQVRGLAKPGSFEDVTFDLRAGEVLGISGLLGVGPHLAGQGAVRAGGCPKRAAITVDGRAVPLGDPLAAAQAGIGYVPEDRLTEGLFLAQSIARNVAIGRLEAHNRGRVSSISAGCWPRRRTGCAASRSRRPMPEAPVRSLSGGNQQRVVLARWLARGPRVLVLNGPSVGVDVGSKSEIHGIIADLRGRGWG